MVQGRQWLWGEQEREFPFDCFFHFMPVKAKAFAERVGENGE